MKNGSKKLLLFACLMAAILLPQIIFAANPALNTLDNIASGDKGPYQQASALSILGIIGVIINMVLGLLGIVFLILIIFAGYNWMTAEGQEEKVTKAKDTITRAVIGIIIVIGSYAIWKFLSSIL